MKNKVNRQNFLRTILHKQKYMLFAEDNKIEKMNLKMLPEVKTYP